MAAKHSLKIGLVLDTSLDPPDGVQQYVTGIGEWLRRQGHDVHYLVGQSSRQDLKNVHSLARNIGVSFNGNRTTIPLPTSRRKLKNFLKHQSYDVLHVQMPHSPFFSQRLIAAADERTAVIGTFHILPYGRLAAIGNRLLGFWLKPSLKRFDRVVSVSTAAAEFARRSYRIQTGVLPNVIDYRLFNRAEPLTESNPGELTILFLGRLVERKGCQVLLKAINQLKNHDLPAYRVVICGKGPLRGDLQRYVEKNQLKNVEFKGFVSEADKPRYYAAADISVFPSSSGESFGIVLLEAMASGRAAVLAGDNPGYRSVINRDDLLFDTKDAAGLADKLKLLITDDAQRMAAAAWGQQYSAEFDVDLIGKKIILIYEQALRKRTQL